MTEPASQIGAALDNPQVTPRLVAEGDPGPSHANGKGERPPWPPGSPVKPLGIKSEMDGKITCYYLDHLGQLVGLEANNKHGKNSLVALFGPQSGWLEQAHTFPMWSKPRYEGAGNARRMVAPSEIVGFDQAEASRAMIEECGRKGVFNAAGKLRGSGAHALANGRLAVHYGDKIMVPRWRADGRIEQWEWHDPGLIEDYVYPAADALPRPVAASVSPRAAISLTQLLQTWNWRRGLLDVRLALGWLAAAPLGGALDWRPNVWITGGAGTGKSTLNGRDKVFHRLLGKGVFRTGDASAAGIRQSLRNSTRPVMFDEIEASADNRRVMEVVQLARLASSGDNTVRGGQDHNATEFTIQSCFQFSSINIPPLEPQDRSRLAILELKPFPVGAKAPRLDDFNFAEMGRELHRRVIDGWPRLTTTKAAYHEALAAAGHGARACDQFGTLLACADLAMNDVLDLEEVQEWVDLCRPERLAEVHEATRDEVGCLNHLLTSTVQARGGDERESLSTWIGRAVQNGVTPLFSDPLAADKTNDRLHQIGLKVVNAVYHPAQHAPDGALVQGERWGSRMFDPLAPGYLAIAGDHQGLNKLFEGTKWRGIHRAVLSRIDDTLTSKVKFGKSSLGAVLVPLAALLDGDDLPAESRPDAVAAWVAAQKKGQGA